MIVQVRYFKTCNAASTGAPNDSHVKRRTFSVAACCDNVYMYVYSVYMLTRTEPSRRNV